MPIRVFNHLVVQDGLVQQAAAGSSARAGDLVFGINGRVLKGGDADLLKAVKDLGIGSEIEMVLLRGSEIIIIHPTVAEVQQLTVPPKLAAKVSTPSSPPKPSGRLASSTNISGGHPPVPARSPNAPGMRPVQQYAPPPIHVPRPVPAAMQQAPAQSALSRQVRVMPGKPLPPDPPQAARSSFSPSKVAQQIVDTTPLVKPVDGKQQDDFADLSPSESESDDSESPPRKPISTARVQSSHPPAQRQPPLPVQRQPPQPPVQAPPPPPPPQMKKPPPPPSLSSEEVTRQENQQKERELLRMLQQEKKEHLAQQQLQQQQQPHDQRQQQPPHYQQQHHKQQQQQHQQQPPPPHYQQQHQQHVQPHDQSEHQHQGNQQDVINERKRREKEPILPTPSDVRTPECVTSSVGSKGDQKQWATTPGKRPKIAMQWQGGVIGPRFE